MNYLFFDTETNGKIKDFAIPLSRTSIDNFPRVTQLGYCIYSDSKDYLFNGDASLVAQFQTLIKPDGWEVPKEKFFIDNNMSTERCMAEGIPIKEALQKFTTALSFCDVLIAHNIDFDHPVLGAEMIRAGITGKKLLRICTMKSTVDFCQLNFNPKYNTYKYPKLEELHMKLFNEGIENAHDALGDVKTTVKCFFKLKTLGIIKV
jgi:DNA polymerase III subunit epsilon